MTTPLRKVLCRSTCLALLYCLITLASLVWSTTPITAVPLQAGRISSEAAMWPNKPLQKPKPTKKPPKPTHTSPPTLQPPSLTDTPLPTATSTPNATNTPTPFPSVSPPLMDTPTPTHTATPDPTAPTPPSTSTPIPTAVPTPTSPVASPRLALTKSDFLASDADENNLVSPGDTLLYAIRVSNLAQVPAQQLHLVDTLDPNTTLVVGTVQTDLGTVSQGNGPGDARVTIDIDTLAPGARVTLSFHVSIKPHVNDTQVQNQVIATFANPEGSSNGQTVVISDDPDTTAALDATITPLNGLQPRPSYPLFLPFVARQL